MKKVLEKHPIVKYVIQSYLYFLLYSCLGLGFIFGILQITGFYSQLETALDLKYNSPFVLIPLYGSAIIAILCLVIGVLLYFHKYKRSKMKSVFYKSFSKILIEKSEE